jgi:stage III sporulation protein AD
MSDAFVVLAAALLAAVLCAMLKDTVPGLALFLSVAAALVILARIGAALQQLLAWLAALQSQSNSELFACLLRAAGILLMTDYMCALCRESGVDAVAWCVEFAGRCLMLAAAWPILREVYQTIWELIG